MLLLVSCFHAIPSKMQENVLRDPALEIAASARAGGDFLLNRFKMGVEVQTIVPGDNKSYPKAGQKLSMHYIGTLASNNQVQFVQRCPLQE